LYGFRIAIETAAAEKIASHSVSLVQQERLIVVLEAFEEVRVQNAHHLLPSSRENA